MDDLVIVEHAKCNLDRDRVLRELEESLSRLKEEGKGDKSVFFGVHNPNVFKDGTVVEGKPALRVLDEDEWKNELRIYSTSGLVVKAVEVFKSEITQVVFFPEWGEDRKFELRFYSVNWEDPIMAADPLPTEDPRLGVLPKMLSDFEFVDRAIYMYVEMKVFDVSSWNECCVCGIQRKESISCEWNESLSFCSSTCSSIAWCQKAHDDGKDVSEIRESEEMNELKRHLSSLNV